MIRAAAAVAAIASIVTWPQTKVKRKKKKKGEEGEEEEEEEEEETVVADGPVLLPVLVTNSPRGEAILLTPIWIQGL